MVFIPTPRAATHSKTSAGISDTTYTNGIYKFMNASIININLSQGFNSTPGSLSLTLIEDKGDDFFEPDTPSVWAMSLPKGGVGSVVFPSSSIDLQPDGFSHSNVPFYFCGICTSWTKNIVDSGGRTISVSVVDTREILRGIQCLISGFSLSQNIGTGSEEEPIPRYQLVDNVIDCFGYWDYGMESGNNEFGMPWNKIRSSILASGVTINDINIEFTFSGTAFFNTPDWYRIDGSTTDILSLVSRVCADGGSDLVVISRKINTNTILVEFKAIRRANFNPLTQIELQSFLDAREGMVESANIGKEYRNEPTSNIIIGGMKNSNYLALPSELKSQFNSKPGTEVSYSFVNPTDGVTYSGKQSFTSANSAGKEYFKNNITAQFSNAVISEEARQIADWDSFPHDIITRLFGGMTRQFSSDVVGNAISVEQNNYDVDSGSIFPFWGFSPGGEANGSSKESSYPLIEPFLPLDHLVLDRQSELYANITQKIPLVKIVIDNFNVRQVQHTDVFLNGDGDSDLRPFAKLDRDSNNNINYVLNSVDIPGHTRGLPLNTEILRAALSGEDTFFTIYGIYFPEIAKTLGFRRINWDAILKYVETFNALDNIPDLKSININEYMISSIEEAEANKDVVTTNGRVSKSDANLINASAKKYKKNILNNFTQIIYNKVKEYAEQYVGRQFVVCLPKSTIMNRIWNGEEVPTRVEKPEIEYVVTDRGYWETIPTDFDGLEDDDSISTDAELQIKRRFQAEDGRFYSMAIMEWQPRGNISFSSNGFTKAMFQDLPVSEFRPNRIASGNTEFIFISCSVAQMIRRPDLALVTLPSAVRFDPNDLATRFADMEASPTSSNSTGIAGDKVLKFLWYSLKYDNLARSLFKEVASANGIPFYSYASSVLKKWKDDLRRDITGLFNKFDMASDIVMDLKGVVIPLTSTWVSYGPWFANNTQAKGMVSIDIDTSLVPWNFERPIGSWDENLNAAGVEKLERSISITDYVDNAAITVAGFPEFGISDNLGFNSNLTTISIGFGIDGIKTTYVLSTFSARPGTYRKSDYDDISKVIIDSRKTLSDVQNINIIQTITGESYGVNTFRN